jgi:hypothetical protein
MHAHATISAWQREEDGSYVAELHGLRLKVVWHPESEGTRGFSYELSRPGEEGGEEGLVVAKGDELVEEIEGCMARAEEHARSLA